LNRCSFGFEQRSVQGSEISRRAAGPQNTLAHRKVEAEGIHESAKPTAACSGQDSDLMWPAAIKRGRGKFALFFGPIELPH
jgi:hypothetical protein